MPDFEKLIAGNALPRKQTAREQVAIWQAFAARSGGKFVPVKGES